MEEEERKSKVQAGKDAVSAFVVVIVLLLLLLLLFLFILFVCLYSC